MTQITIVTVKPFLLHSLFHCQRTEQLSANADKFPHLRKSGFLYRSRKPITINDIKEPIILTRLTTVRQIFSGRSKTNIRDKRTHTITNIITNSSQQIIFKRFFKNLTPHRSITAKSGTSPSNFWMGTKLSGGSLQVAGYNLRRINLHQARTNSVILSTYYTTRCPAVNTDRKTRRLRMIEKRALSVTRGLTHHILLGGIHVKSEKEPIEWEVP